MHACISKTAIIRCPDCGHDTGIKLGGFYKEPTVAEWPLSSAVIGEIVVGLQHHATHVPAGKVVATKMVHLRDPKTKRPLTDEKGQSLYKERHTRAKSTSCTLTCSVCTSHADKADSLTWVQIDTALLGPFCLAHHRCKSVLNEALENLHEDVPVFVVTREVAASLLTGIKATVTTEKKEASVSLF